MNKKEIVQLLREEANRNEASKAVFYWMSLRDRTRDRIYLDNLYRKMLLAGFKYSKLDYAPVLRCLAKVGFGQLKIGAGGRVQGLTGIYTTLQSIGKAALGESHDLEVFKPRTKYEAFDSSVSRPRPKRIIEVEAEVVKPEPTKQEHFKVGLEIRIHGKQVKLDLPEGLTPEEISTLVTKMVS